MLSGRDGSSSGFLLELAAAASYCRRMKRISCLLITLSLCATPAARSQDAATEERLNKLSGQIEDLIAAQKDLKHLAEAVKEVDRKRLEDYDKIHAELLKLGKTLSAPVSSAKKSAPPTALDGPGTEKAGPPQKGFDYTIEKNDNLSMIVQAYREKNIKVTIDQILKANPGLNPD